jgi:hypothetical protein
MSLTIKTYSLNSTGDSVVECKLWQYYFFEVMRALSFSNNALGPTSGSSFAAVITLIEHVLCSTVGGAAMLGIGWVVCKIRGRRRVAA